MSSKNPIIRVALLSATFAIATLISVSATRAATFSIVGGTSTTLPGEYNPDGLAAAHPDGINVGTAIKYFQAGTNNTQGLFVSPSSVSLQFTYMGQEAGFANTADDQLFYDGTPLFNNHTTAPGTSVLQSFSLSGNPGLVPFLFHSNDNSSFNAINGGPIDSNLRIAFAVFGNIAYAFFDDGGAGPDHDYDDMVIKIQAFDAALTTPLPGAVILFASGLVGLTAFGRRRRKVICDQNRIAATC